jgi:hypothetical protein
VAQNEKQEEAVTERKKNQDKPCTYNVTLRHFRLTTDAVEK